MKERCLRDIRLELIQSHYRLLLVGMNLAQIDHRLAGLLQQNRLPVKGGHETTKGTPRAPDAKDSG